MITTPARTITLGEFLKLPKTKPASEYIEGEIIQKPMPKGKHSRLQLRLCNAINDVAEGGKIAYAFPELRCSFGTRSIVPDVAVFEWSRIPFDADGEAPNDFLIHPSWTIEILSPEQSSNRIIGNILYCIRHGCRLGWLLAQTTTRTVPGRRLPACTRRNRSGTNRRSGFQLAKDGRLVAALV